MNIVNKISVLSFVKHPNACVLVGTWRANRNFSTSSPVCTKDHYKLLIVGGGTGGLSTGAKFARSLARGKIALVDGAEWHYYQPGWTLAAGGVEKAETYRRHEKNLIPKGVTWYKNNVVSFDPDNSSVQLDNGQKIKYEYMIVSTGIRIDFDGIKGLREAMANDPSVVSMYSHESVQKVFPAIQNFKEGNAIFTFPKMPIKCPGAPQKIMYLAEDYMRKNGTRDKANVIYCTTIAAIFGVKKYAEALMNIVKERNIQLNTQTHLIEVDYKNKQAIFEKLDKPGEIVKMDYSLLHVAPPMRPHDVVKNSKLADPNGFVDIHKETLQHKKYENVFAIGDCTNMPTSKTAAAIAAQSPILYKNLSNLMHGHKHQVPAYNGYTSCPLVTGYNKLILAEFDFNGQPLETFPIDQGKESRIMYSLKKDFMPPLYWDGLLKGLWNGPGFARKLFLKN